MPLGDAEHSIDASTRVTHACTEAAALPTSEKKNCMQMMCCAPQARKICTKKVKVVPKRRAREWPLRAAAKLPVCPDAKSQPRSARLVRELGSGWRARSLTVDNGGVTD